MRKLLTSTMAALIAGGVVALAPSASAAPESGESVSAVDCTVTATGTPDVYVDVSGQHLGIKVTIYWNPCGRSVRARAHCNGFPAGTYYRRGASATAPGFSWAYCDGGDPRYGKQGWEENYNGSWHFHESFQ